MAQFWLTFLLTCVHLLPLFLRPLTDSLFLPPCSLFVGVEPGLVSSVAFSLILVVSQSTQPRITVSIGELFTWSDLAWLIFSIACRSSATSTTTGSLLTTTTEQRRRTSLVFWSFESASR